MADTVEKAENAGEAKAAPEKTAIEAQAAAERPAGQPFEIAVLALQNTTLFPETVAPLAVGRPRSVAALEAALATEEKLIACITVRADVNTASRTRSPRIFIRSARWP